MIPSPDLASASAVTEHALPDHQLSEGDHPVVSEAGGPASTEDLHAPAHNSDKQGQTCLLDDKKGANSSNQLSNLSELSQLEELTQLDNLCLTESPRKRKMTKEDFMSSTGNLQANIDPTDPLSQLNPMWTLK